MFAIDCSPKSYGKLSGITKSFTTEADVPALKLTFLVAGILQEEHIRDSDDLGRLELEVRSRNTMLNIFSP